MGVVADENFCRIFNTRNELIESIKLIGAKHNIFEEIVNNKYSYMLTCPNCFTTKCSASILGIFNSHDNKFYIKLCELCHSCQFYEPEMFHKKEFMKHLETNSGRNIKSTDDSTYRSTDINNVVTKCLRKGYSVSYFDIYRLVSAETNPLSTLCLDPASDSKAGAFMSCLHYFYQSFVALNPHIFSRIEAEYFFYKHPEYPFYLRNVTEVKIYTTAFGCLILGLMYDPNDMPIIQSAMFSTKARPAALSDFLRLDAEESDRYYDCDKLDAKRNIWNFTSEESAIKHKTMHKVNTKESSKEPSDSIKKCMSEVEDVNTKENVNNKENVTNKENVNNKENANEKENINNRGHSDDENMLRNNKIFKRNSEELSKNSQIEKTYIEKEDKNSALNMRKYQNYYCVDFFDSELIEICTEMKINFFIKTRTLCKSLYVHGTGESLIGVYFSNLNYGDEEYLHIDKKHYLRKYCAFELYNINNAPVGHLDYLSEDVLKLPLIDCANAVLWHESRDIRKRQNISSEHVENPLSAMAMEHLEILKETAVTKNYEVSLDSLHCPCGKFQEYLMPCSHAYKKIKEHGLDPVNYFSSLYFTTNLLGLVPVEPVVKCSPGVNIVDNKFQEE
ncbi:hypothetical protein ENBRE01_0325 [Enteropsectra breve]|nr:hypothetical protein ENBRE01_0325 [Enteropsectra breve]